MKPEAENENPICINWDHVDQWWQLLQVKDKVSRQEHIVLLTSEQEQAKYVIDAKKRDIENMEIHEVYECVSGMSQKCISTRWVTEKSKDNKKIMKARAHGYKEDLHNLKIDSSACNCEALHLVMLTASVMNQQVVTLDFTSAFLQGDMLKREIIS